MLQAFTIKHHGHNGTGSGTSVVVASSERMALVMLKDHFDAKDEGYRQYSRMDLLEVELHEDSDLSGESVDTSSAGVLLEYHYDEGDHIGQIVHFGFPVEEIVAELDALQKEKHDGRGVSCVQTLIHFLDVGDFSKAKAVCNNEGDKIRNYPDIVAVLKRIGFWYEIDFSSWGE